MSLFLTHNDGEQAQLKDLAESIAKSRGLPMDIARMRQPSVKLTLKDIMELQTMDVPTANQTVSTDSGSDYTKFQEEQIKMLRRAGFDESTFATIIKTMWEEQKKRKGSSALTTPIKKGPGRPKGSLNKPKTPNAPKKDKKRKYNMTKSVLNNNCGLLTLKSICDALNINVSGNKEELSTRISKVFGKDSDEMNKLSSKLLGEIIEDITEEPGPSSKKDQIKALKEHCNLD